MATRKKAAPKAAEQAPEAEAAAPVVVAYKGFDKDLKCRGFQYAIGETFEHAGQVKACNAGFHACEHPLSVFAYYAPSDARFALVELSGDMHREESGDTKVAAARITIKAELTIPALIQHAVDWVMARCTPEGEAATGTQGAASATGDRGAASATGFQGAASATGTRGAASATGTQGAASATGFLGAASATGYQGAASATGYLGAASATGFLGAASATGTQGAASATGFQGAASATGTRGAASATGTRGAASATGFLGAASATGYQGAASATGEASVAMATGWEGRAKAAAGGAIVLVCRAEDLSIKFIKASKVGENGIKPDTFYMLDTAGEFVEAAP